MADSFFGFDTSLTGDGLGDGLDDGLDGPLEEEEIICEEDEYDALNDETFGADATGGDWEQDHEKLAQITESCRTQHVPNLPLHKNGIDVDIEDSLSHLVLDDRDGTTPRPGVWDSPTNLPLPRNQQRHPITNTLKNVCTVEELERGLIARGPPPGLGKPLPPPPQHQQQQQQHQQQQQQQQQQQPHQQQQQPPPPTGGGFMFDSIPLSELHIKGLPPRFPPGLGLPGPPVVLPPSVRQPPPQFMQHHRLLPNQPGNMLRYPLPPHLMMPPGAQRQPPPASFRNNFPQPPYPGMPPPQLLRPEHPMMPPFANNQMNHHHQHQHPNQHPNHNQHQHQLQHQHQHQHQQHSPHSGNQRTVQNNRPFHSNDQPPLPPLPPPPPNHQPFFKNNQYPHYNHNRNNQRHHHQGMNGNNGSMGDYDEYSGLMSNREKQWLINIQLLQLNTNQPYVEDYYYTVFCDRQNKLNENQEKHKDKRHHNNNGHHTRDSRDRDQPQHILTKVVYTPMQFENSLGKLQCGSVTAPRKIIDMDVVPNNDPQQTPHPQQKDSKKTRQLLLEIERLYTMQLKLEDLTNPLALLAAAEQQQQQLQEGESEKKPIKETKIELIGKLIASFLQLLKDDKLAALLSIRKGKMLLLRLLPHMSVTEYSSQLGDLWTGLLRGLVVIGRRDSHLLANFYPEFRRWIHTITDFVTVLRLAKALAESASQNIKNNSLAFALTNKFGVSVIASVLEQAETLFPIEDTLTHDWSTFVMSVVETLGVTPPSVAPCQPIAANTLNQHLNRIHSLKMERYAPLELLFTDANPIR